MKFSISYEGRTEEIEVADVIDKVPSLGFGPDATPVIVEKVNVNATRERAWDAFKKLTGLRRKANDEAPVIVEA